MKQVIYSRYEYPMGDKSTQEVFTEYNEMFMNTVNERGITVGGVTSAINIDAKTVILLVYSKDADAFLRLKFCGRKDVKFSSYNT